MASPSILFQGPPPHYTISLAPEGPFEVMEAELDFNMHTAIIDLRHYHKHATRNCEENQERYVAIVEALKARGLMTIENTILARPAPREVLELCHTPGYLDLLQRECEKVPCGSQAKLSTGDVQISPYSFAVACLAAGAVLSGIDAVMSGAAKNAFCLVRPPGHHAYRDKGEGFCLLNNVAIGARYAQQEWKLKRVAIIDWDIHHGNGTQNIIEGDPSILYVSTHKKSKGFYPETGSKSPHKNILNFPISGGRNSAMELLSVFSEQIIPALAKFKPEFILISAGFDAHKDDFLGGYEHIEGGFNLDEKSFATLTDIIKNYADDYLDGRLVSVLEGGYNPKALSASVCAHVSALNQLRIITPTEKESSSDLMELDNL